MNERNDMGISFLLRRLVDDLQAEFPGWQISREQSGRWVADRPGWGLLYGQSATELRDRLGRFTARGDVR